MKLADVLANSKVHSILNHMLSSVRNALHSIASSSGLFGGTQIPSISSMYLLYNRSLKMNHLRMQTSCVPKVVVAYVGAGCVPIVAPVSWRKCTSPNVKMLYFIMKLRASLMAVIGRCQK
eukprot:13322029-Ditylum_brightwellii.AAC.1